MKETENLVTFVTTINTNTVAKGWSDNEGQQSGDLLGTATTSLLINSGRTMRARLPPIETIGPNAPLRLDVAAALLFPHGEMTASEICSSPSEQRIATLGLVAARLLRPYAAQLEILGWLRHGGPHVVRIEHVEVHDGGQAIVGVVNSAQPFC